MARGSAVDESRERTAKILVTPHPGYFDCERLQKKNSLTSHLLSGAHQVQKHFRNHQVTTLDDDDASLRSDGDGRG